MEEEIIGIFLPIVVTGNLIGLFPYKISNTGDIVINKFSAIYALIIFIISIYNLFYVSIWCVLFKEDTKIINTIAERIYIFYKISEAITFCLTFFCLQLDVKNNSMKIQGLISIHNLFNDNGIKYSYKKLKYTFIKRYITFFIYVIMVFVTDYFITLRGAHFNITLSSWIFGNIAIGINFILSFH